jgi:hypothetical protein
MRSAIMKTTKNRGNPSLNTNRNQTSGNGPRRFYFNKEERDPNAMDIDAMSPEQVDMMKKCLFFLCKKPGHISRNCPDKNQGQSSPPPKKMKRKDLYMHMKALMTKMDNDKVEEFFKESEEQGF